jgi:hypothetical protein
MFKLFQKRPKAVEVQLQELATCGITLTPGITLNDLYIFDNRAAMEQEPFGPLVEALGHCTEDGEDTPFCANLWMCDFECIEDHGAYVAIIDRLDLLSRHRLSPEFVRDYVDVEAKVAWVELTVNSHQIHWDANVQEDWVDPDIFLKFGQLLAEHTDLRLYGNFTDYGQVAFFGCFTEAEFSRFRKLSKVKLEAITTES